MATPPLTERADSPEARSRLRPAQPLDLTLLESLDDSLIAMHLDGTILGWSRGAEQLYGFPRAEAVGRKVHDLLKTVSLISLETIRSALLSPEGRWAGELRKTRSDGTPITVRSRQHLVTDPHGVRIVIACDRDQTARERAADSFRRRRDDTSLVEMRERFQFATDAAHIGYWFCDLPFDKLIWDARVKEHFWLPPDADVDIGLFYRQLHPDDRERTRLAIEKSIGTHTRYDIEYRTVSPEGAERWLHALGRTAYDAAGVPIRFDGITQDITSLKQAQALLHETELQLTGFADSIPAMACIARPDGSIAWYNRRWYEYTGTTPEQMEGWGWRSVHDPAVLPAVMERWRHSIETGEPFEMIFPLRAADGSFRSFLSRATPFRNRQGEIVRWFGTITQVDELERTRRELQLAEERVRIALQSVDIILYTTDRDLRYTWMYCAHPGYRAEEMVGRRDIDIEPESLREIHALKRSVLESGVAVRREMTLLLQGKVEVFAFNIEPLRDPNGEIIGLTVAALNITQMRRAEDALRRTEKLALVGRLAASIAHEINNPLESVVSLLYLVGTMVKDDEALRYISMAEEELKRVAHVVTHSLRFHRQSHGASSVLVSSLIDSALALYRGRLSGSPIRVVTDFRDTEPLLCLPSDLRQVFANLIGNSFEATRKGRIELRTRLSSGWKTGRPGIRVTVADTGQGIDPATLPHIFEPFVTTKGELGTGLGLWVSAEILSRHNALVRVRSSVQPGRSGTVFSIFFPLTDVPPYRQLDGESSLGRFV